MRIVGHTEQLRLSRCYQASETLTCTTCHDSHAPPPEDKVLRYRAKCLECHGEDACGVPLAERRAKLGVDNCATCHMPPAQTEVPHIAATHHRIGIHKPAGESPSGGEPAVSAAGGELLPLSDLSSLPPVERNRCLGLSYLQLSLQTPEAGPSESYRVRAREILGRVIQDGLRDPETDAALATIYQRENPDRAVEFGQRALRSAQLTPDVRVQALAAVSMAHIHAGRTQLAIAPLGLLVGLRRQGTDWYLLAVCRFQAGDIPGAIAAAEKAAEIRPDNPKARELLAEVYRQDGQLDRAEQAEAMRQAILNSRPAAP